MSRFNTVMVDLETMGGPPDGAIAAIGACFFNERTGEIGPTFYQVVHLGSAQADGGQIDAATVTFWLGQPDKARMEIRFGGLHIHKVLQSFSDWILETCRHEDVKLYGNGATFDLVILRSAYKRAKIPLPWYWTGERCFRTVRNRYPQVEYNPDDKGEDAHNALADAVFQAKHLGKIQEYLRARKQG